MRSLFIWLSIAWFFTVPVSPHAHGQSQSSTRAEGSAGSQPTLGSRAKEKSSETGQLHEVAEPGDAARDPILSELKGYFSRAPKSQTHEAYLLAEGLTSEYSGTNIGAVSEFFLLTVDFNATQSIDNQFPLRIGQFGQDYPQFREPVSFCVQMADFIRAQEGEKAALEFLLHAEQALHDHSFADLVQNKRRLMEIDLRWRQRAWASRTASLTKAMPAPKKDTQSSASRGVFKVDATAIDGRRVATRNRWTLAVQGHMQWGFT